MPWPGILGMVLCAELSVAVYTSPWTGLRSVTVVGAMDRDRTNLTQVLQPYRNQAVLSIDRTRLRKAIETEPRIKTATIARGLDGRLTVGLQYRWPFASVQSGDGWIDVDSEGVPFERSTVNQAFRISFNEPPQVKLGLPSARLEDPLVVIRETVQRRLAKAATVTVDRDGQMCLNLAGSAPIRLGSGVRISAKLDALQSILKQDDTILTRAEYLDLKCPEAPAWKRRPAAEGQ